MRGVAAGPSSPATTRVRGNTWSFSKVRTIFPLSIQEILRRFLGQPIHSSGRSRLLSMDSSAAESTEVASWCRKAVCGRWERADVGGQDPRPWCRVGKVAPRWLGHRHKIRPRGEPGEREHEQHDRQGIAPLTLQPPGPIEGDPCRPKVRWTIRVPGSMHVSVEQSMGSHGDEIDHDGQCHDTPDHPRRQNKMPPREYGRMEGKMTRRRREWCQLGQSRRGKGLVDGFSVAIPAALETDID